MLHERIVDLNVCAELNLGVKYDSCIARILFVIYVPYTSTTKPTLFFVVDLNVNVCSLG